MACGHDNFRTIDSSYDRRRGMLVYYWRCEECGTRLGEARRVTYRPDFDPRGAQAALPSAEPG
jgi:hypothetical protein